MIKKHNKLIRDRILEIIEANKEKSYFRILNKKEYIQEIKKARAIYMKGPAGFCGYKGFCKGTRALLMAIAKNKGFSLIGGGHLSDAIKQTKTNKSKFNHISLSGGALLRYVAGEKLPGLEALK